MSGTPPPDLPTAYWILVAVVGALVPAFLLVVRAAVGRMERDIDACAASSKEQTLALQAVRETLIKVQSEQLDRANIGGLIRESETRMEASLSALRSDLTALRSDLLSALRENSGLRRVGGGS